MFFSARRQQALIRFVRDTYRAVPMDLPSRWTVPDEQASVELPGLGLNSSSLPDLPDDPFKTDDGWTPGGNCPSIGAGGDRLSGISKQVGLQAYHILNNIVTNFGKLPPAELRGMCRLFIASGVHVQKWTTPGLTSALTCVVFETVRSQTRRTTIPTAIPHPMHFKGYARSLVDASGLADACDPVESAPLTASPASSAVPVHSTVVWSAAPNAPSCNSANEAGFRVSCLCAWIFSNGFPHSSFPKLVRTMSSLFPGQFGERHHSRRFLTRYRQSLLDETIWVQRLALHTVVLALGTPSHIVRTFDTVTPKSGDTLLEEVVHYTDAQGHMRWALVDMVPLAADVAHIIVARAEPAVFESDPLSRLSASGATVAPSSGDLPALAYHGNDKVSDAILELERRAGLSPAEMRWRLAMNSADGAFFGGVTGDLIGQLLSEKQGIQNGRVAHQLCDWHGIVKALEHADRLREHGVAALTQRYYKLTRSLRRQFAYGTGQKVAKAMAVKFNLPWVRPAAPQEGGTRTEAFEIQRVPPVFLNNFVVYYQSLIALLTQGPKIQRKLVHVGKELTDPSLFCFILARYETRKPLIRYINVAQQVHQAGFERIRQQECVMHELDANVGTLHCLVGLVGTVCRVLRFCAPWDRHSGLRTSPISLAVFTQVLLQAAGVSRRYPLVAKILPPLFLNRAVFGLPIGYRLADDAKVATAKGWQVGPFDTAVEVSHALVPKMRLQRAQRQQRHGALCAELGKGISGAFRSVLALAKRDRLLFATRVLYSDSPVAPSRRFASKTSEVSERPESMSAASSSSGLPVAVAASSSGSAAPAGPSSQGDPQTVKRRRLRRGKDDGTPREIKGHLASDSSSASDSQNSSDSSYSGSGRSSSSSASSLEV